MCGQAMAEEWTRTGAVTEAGLRRGYLRRWDDEFLLMFRFLDLLQQVFYSGNAGRESLVEMCADEYVQRRTFESCCGGRWPAWCAPASSVGRWSACAASSCKLENFACSSIRVVFNDNVVMCKHLRLMVPQWLISLMHFIPFSNYNSNLL
jgi:hypothetical protein